jgi:para-nitrobenzyl esterase
MTKTLIKTLIGSVLVCGMLVAGMATPAIAAAPGAVVRTGDGFVRGVVTEDHRIFQGVPYARPPVGELRLRSPEQVRPWSGIRDATRAGSICAQTYVYPPGTPQQFAGSEDCLYLNVHVPRGVPGRMPVMVFLHGGNAGAGSGYDPRPVTGLGDVIVVTINYRLGALGFLRHVSLTDPFSGNFGLADQQSALRWVKSNIGSFGGDPGNVTLWGESYGGFGVCAQLASPLARGLFDKAIVQSAPCGNDLVTRQEADRRGSRAVEVLGCSAARDVAACVRAVPAERMAGLPNDVTHQRDIATALPWFYTAGTAVIPRQPLDAARAGQVHDVPLIHGGTRDEMRSVIAGWHDGLGTPVTAERYPQIVESLYGVDTPAVLARYPQSAYPSPGLALAALQTDEGRMDGTCRQLSYNDGHRRLAPVYAYEFAEESTEVVGELPLGAHHGVDIPYFFDSYFGAAANADPDLADYLVQRWTTFARAGRPGAGWTAYQPGKALSISSSRIGPADVSRQHQCDFWSLV